MKKQNCNPYVPDLSDPLTGRFVLQTVLGFLSIHFLIWAVVAQMLQVEWLQLLNHWDSRWYSGIVQKGYAEKSLAFYPFYPFCIIAAAWGTGHWVPAPILGALVSTLLFLAFCGSIFSTKTSGPLRPKTKLGWLLFLCWPGSMIFHSHHTESLFLFLTFWTFFHAQQRRWILASLLAGLCALTRSHGVLVAITAGVWVAMNAPTLGWGPRVRRFLLSGCLSASIFSLFPLFQYYRFGDPFLFLKAQSLWTHAQTWKEYIGTFFFLSPHCVFTYMQVTHYIFFLGLWTWFVYFRRQHPFFALYLFLVLMLIPAQLEVVNVFRFGAVLFPILFIAGDWVALTFPRAGQWGLLFYFIVHNLIITMNYAASRWSY